MSTIDFTVAAIIQEAFNDRGASSEPRNFFELIESSFRRLNEQNTELAARARNLSPEQQVQLVLEVARKGAQREDASYALQPLISSVLRRKLAFSESRILDLLASLQQWRFGGPLLPVLRMVGRHPITPDTAAALRRLRSHSWLRSGYADVREINQRLDQMLELGVVDDTFDPAGSWSKHVRQCLCDNPAKQAVTHLLATGKDIRELGIHLTQVTPRCSVGPGGGLPARPTRIRVSLCERGGLPRLSVRLALARGFPLSKVWA